MTSLRTAMAAVAMAATLTASQAIAADGPLAAAPGKPAGVAAAQHSSKLLLIGGAMLVTVVAVAVAVASTDNQQCGTACNVTPTTTS